MHTIRHSTRQCIGQLQAWSAYEEIQSNLFNSETAKKCTVACCPCHSVLCYRTGSAASSEVGSAQTLTRHRLCSSSVSLSASAFLIVAISQPPPLRPPSDPVPNQLLFLLSPLYPSDSVVRLAQSQVSVDLTPTRQLRASCPDPSKRELNKATCELEKKYHFISQNPAIHIVVTKVRIAPGQSPRKLGYM